MIRKSIGFVLITIFLVSITGCSDNISKQAKENLASCLSEKGVVMFGAFWCSHCQQQKKLFGDAWDKISYVECSLPDGKSQTEVCKQAGIESYPTWEFAPGDRVAGQLSLEALSAKTNCPLD